jgi:glycine cleavage system H protein
MKKNECRYSRSHVWVRESGGVLVCGITEYASNQFGEKVFIELPEVGRFVKKDKEFAIIESVKAAGEVEMPMSGTIVAVNEDLSEYPQAIDSGPEFDGWLVIFMADDINEWNELLSENEYRKMLQEELDSSNNAG